MAIFKTKHLQPGQKVTFTVDGKTHQGKAITPIHGGDAFAFRQDDGTIGVIGNSAKLTQKTTSVERNRPKEKSKKTYQIKTLYKKENELILSGDRPSTIIDTLNPDLDSISAKIDGDKKKWVASYRYSTYIEDELFFARTVSNSGDWESQVESKSANWVLPNGWGAFSCWEGGRFLWEQILNFEDMVGTQFIDGNSAYFAPWDRTDNNLPVNAELTYFYLANDLENDPNVYDVGVGSFCVVPSEETIPELGNIAESNFNHSAITAAQVENWLNGFGLGDFKGACQSGAFEGFALKYYEGRFGPTVAYDGVTPTKAYFNIYNSLVGDSLTLYPPYEDLVPYLHNSIPFRVFHRWVTGNPWATDGRNPVAEYSISSAIYSYNRGYLSGESEGYSYSQTIFSYRQNTVSPIGFNNYQLGYYLYSSDATLDLPVILNQSIELNSIPIDYASATARCIYTKESRVIAGIDPYDNFLGLNKGSSETSLSLLGSSYPVNYKGLRYEASLSSQNVPQSGENVQIESTSIWLKGEDNNHIAVKVKLQKRSQTVSGSLTGGLLTPTVSRIYYFNGAEITSYPEDIADLSVFNPFFCSLKGNKLYTVSSEDLTEQKRKVEVTEYSIVGNSLIKGKTQKVPVKYPSGVGDLLLLSASFG